MWAAKAHHRLFSMIILIAKQFTSTFKTFTLQKENMGNTQPNCQMSPSTSTNCITVIVFTQGWLVLSC